jgi:hypothetical protein
MMPKISDTDDRGRTKDIPTHLLKIYKIMIEK